MGDFNSEGKWDTQLPSILPLPTEDEIFDDAYSTAQVMDMRYHIDELEAKVERLEKAATESAAELRMQLQHGCPHLAGDLCIKEGACECYGSTGG